jgi:hypothetical protein
MWANSGTGFGPCAVSGGGFSTDDVLSRIADVDAGELSEPTSVEFAPFRRAMLFAVANTNTGTVRVFVDSP